MPLYKIKIGEGSCGISAGAGKIHKLLDEKNSGNYTVHAVAASECASLSQ